MLEQEVKVKTSNIRLDQFLKWAEISHTGGMAKTLIKGGRVKVNGDIVWERGKKIKKGDIVEVDNSVFKVI